MKKFLEKQKQENISSKNLIFRRVFLLFQKVKKLSSIVFIFRYKFLYFLLSVCLLSIHLYQVNALVTPKGTQQGGLIGRWTFDTQDISGTVAYDLSGKGNNGTLVSSPTPVSGKIGQALSFNGSTDYVTMPTISISNTITVSAWVYTSLSSQNGFIVGKNAVNSQWELFFEASVLRWRGGASENTVFCDNPSVNQWHHLVGTQTGTDGALYIDGILCDTGTLTAINNGAGTIDIGRFDNAYYFSGKIDDVRIYNRVLSASEIGALYRATGGKQSSSRSETKVGNASGLIAHYTFDGRDFSTATTTDIAGGNTGTINSGITPVVGKIGQAISSDGGSSTNINTSSKTWGFSTTGSVSLWIKTTDDTARVISLAQGGTVNDEFLIYLGLATNKISICNHKSSGVFNCRNSSTSVNNNVWAHVVGVMNGGGGLSNLKIYVNGIEEVGTTSGGAAADISDASARVLYLGRNPSAGENFSGALDDVRIYNRVLSQSEITKLYLAGGGKQNVSNTSALSSGLIGYWTFDGNKLSATTATDSGTGGNNGTRNGTLNAVLGKIGQALTFDGSSGYLDGGASSNLNFERTDKFSISLWTKVTSLSNYRTQISRDNSALKGWGLWLFSSSDPNRTSSPCLVLTVTQTTADLYGCAPNNSLTPYIGKWIHLVATYDGTSDVSGIKIYINNTSQTVTAIRNLLSGSMTLSTNLAIGKSTLSPGYFHSGDMDDVRIYNRVLSPFEVSQLYNLGSR